MRGQKTFVERLHDFMDPPKKSPRRKRLGIVLTCIGALLAAMNLFPIWTIVLILVGVAGLHLWATHEPSIFEEDSNQ